MADNTAVIEAIADNPYAVSATLGEIKAYPGVFEAYIDTLGGFWFNYRVKHFTEAGEALVGYQDLFEFTSSGDTIICSARPPSTRYGSSTSLRMQVVSEVPIKSCTTFARGVKWRRKENSIAFQFSPHRLNRFTKQKLFSFVRRLP